MILMRTGHGKTSFSLGAARQAGYKIANGTTGVENPVIVYVTLEQQVEYMELMLAGNSEYDSSQLIKGEVEPILYNKWATNRTNLPLWVIGQSRQHSDVKQPDLYLETIIEGINVIKYEEKFNPILVYVDYLQKIRLMDGSWNNMNKQVIEASRALKAMAMNLDVPVIFNSQASQDVDDRKDKIPKLNDSMWASESGHESDIVVTGMRPSRYWSPVTDPYVTINNVQYINDDTTLVLQVQKQRFGPGWGTVAVKFVPQTLVISDPGVVDINRSESWQQDDIFNDDL